MPEIYEMPNVLDEILSSMNDDWEDLSYCAHGLSTDDRECTECSLNSYNLDCHNRIINRK